MHKQPLPQSPADKNQAHQRPPERVEYILEATVPAVLLLAPDVLKVTLRPGRVQGNLWMLPPPTARKVHPLSLPQDPVMETPTTWWRCGPQALATPWPIFQLLGRYHHAPTADATPEQR